MEGGEINATARQRSSSATTLKALILNRASRSLSPAAYMSYKAYLPVVSKGGISFEPITARFGTCTSMYVEIAMKKDGEVYTFMVISSMARHDADGNQISKTLPPWGTTDTPRAPALLIMLSQDK